MKRLAEVIELQLADGVVESVFVCLFVSLLGISACLCLSPQLPFQLSSLEGLSRLSPAVLFTSLFPPFFPPLSLSPFLLSVLV